MYLGIIHQHVVTRATQRLGQQLVAAGTRHWVRNSWHVVTPMPEQVLQQKAGLPRARRPVHDHRHKWLLSQVFLQPFARSWMLQIVEQAVCDGSRCRGSLAPPSLCCMAAQRHRPALGTCVPLWQLPATAIQYGASSLQCILPCRCENPFEGRGLRCQGLARLRRLQLSRFISGSRCLLPCRRQCSSEHCVVLFKFLPSFLGVSHGREPALVHASVIRSRGAQCVIVPHFTRSLLLTESY